MTKEEPMKRKQIYVLTLIRRSGCEVHTCHSLDQCMSWVNSISDLLGYRAILKSAFGSTKRGES